MKQTESELIELRILDDGLFQARRKDRQRMTEADWEEAEKLAQRLLGITVHDVIRVFKGGRVLTTLEAAELTYTSGPFELFVRQATVLPTEQVKVNPAITIIDPAKFVSATLVDLNSCVSAINAGRSPLWIQELIDEKIEALRACGVDVDLRKIQ